MKKLRKNQINAIVNSNKIRVGVTKGSFYCFFNIYFSKYIDYPIGDFHEEMIALAQNDKYNLVNIISFRGSGKSTILNTAYIIWNILGKPKKKFILIVGKTKEQAKVFLENICLELKYNDLLKKDFQIQKDTFIFKKTQLDIKANNSIIKIGSLKTTLRGMKKGKYRPDLIICDDLEDVEAVSNKNTRTKNYIWFKQELIPLSGDNTKIILLGNFLHKDSLLNKIHNEIESKVLNGVSKKYPIIDDKNNILWKEKFNLEDIDRLKKTLGSDDSWYNEYLLKDSTENMIKNIEIIVCTKDGRKSIGKVGNFKV